MRLREQELLKPLLHLAVCLPRCIWNPLQSLHLFLLCPLKIWVPIRHQWMMNE